jgi:hypothetical protein
MGRLSDEAFTDWGTMADEDLRQGLGMLLLAVTDPRCDTEMRDHLLAIGQDIRDEIKRRRSQSATFVD